MWQLWLLLLCFSSWIRAPVNAATNPEDAGALSMIFGSLNSPSQLGWKQNGGDPCGEQWKGVTCSGSAVTEIHISNLGLEGNIAYALDKMTSLTTLDMSNNKITGVIPYALPPKVQRLDLSGNSLNGQLPYSISNLTSLEYLSTSRNQIGGSIPDVFWSLSKLSTIELFSNSLTGELPGSMKNLTSLNTLLLQNNQLTGAVNVLTELPLQNLNVANNRFNGWIPNEWKGNSIFQTDGNPWNTGPAPPPPPFTPGRRMGPPKSPPGVNKSDGGEGKSGIGGGGIAGIIISLLIVSLVAAFLIVRWKKSKSFSRSEMLEDQAHAPLAASEIHDMKSSQTFSDTPKMTLQPPAPLSVKPPPVGRHKAHDENDNSYQPIPKKQSKVPSSLAVYSVADLQLATGSFSMDNLLGEGSLGRVYRAQMDDGKVLAVKKLSSSIFSSQASGDFMELISNISRLHHQNVTELVGYCSEHGQYLLAYEFHRNGTLHDFLHLSDEYGKPLTWNTRVKIALGTARGLEYLHEACSPSVIHKNFKSANILLDVELNPHLSDCGLSDLISNQVSDGYMTSGYSAPEVAMTGQYTLKSDVFSFGVVMMELLTGRKPFDSSKGRSEQSLVGWATPQLHDIDALDKMVDPALKGLYPAKSLSRFADVIALCVQSEPEFRPPMSEVVQALIRLIQRANMNKRMGAGDEQEASRHADDMDIHDML